MKSCRSRLASVPAALRLAAGLSALVVLLASSPAAAQPDTQPDPVSDTSSAMPGPPAAELLPAAEYDPAVPTPAEYLGWEVGERHVDPGQLTGYLRQLADSSDRVRFEVQGQSHEGRPLPLLVISTPENLARLEEIRERHRALSQAPFEAGADADVGDQPVVVWLGYSIHGNEASGSNASLLVAYHLAAAEDDALLEDTIVLIDPSLNPDGLARFAQWANMHRGRVLVGDRNHREHNEGWPSGRTNHYWFDLNRDWLPAQHPESRARLATLQTWRPNLLADFHEMGSDSTYFFQPGVPSRQNPLTPDANLDLTRKIARYHADAFDEAGRLYYSEETFDDFYYGKGSTYPDIQGAVGILFEQASARGHLSDTVNGPLSFAQAVGGQVLTSFSTLRAARELRQELLEYQHDFYRQAAEAADADSAVAWVVGDDGDPARAWHFLELLAAHGISARELTSAVTLGGETFRPGHAWAIPLDQRQYRLIEALFERRLEFPDETFYDVSAWTLPLAFDLPYARLPRGGGSARLLGAEVEDPAPPAGRTPDHDGETPYAWAVEWDGYYAPRALYRLLEAGVDARVATQPFEAVTDAGRRGFDRGTVVVPRGLQKYGDELMALLGSLAREDGVDVWALTTGLTPSGIDLGSPSLRRLERPRPLLVVGEGVSAYEAGEVWHLLDRRFGIPLPLVEMGDLARVDLGDYSHVILVDGRWRRMEERVVENLTRWLRDGGVVIATQGAAYWAGDALARPVPGEDEEEGEEPEMAPPSPAVDPSARRPDEAREEPLAEPDAPDRPAYADFEHRFAIGLISGAIFETEFDLTHPLAFGFDDATLPIFRDGSRPLPLSDNPYENVALFTEEPLMAGYASPENVEKIAGSAAVVASRVGRGTLVRMSDDPAFRAFWYGTDRLLLNALFFGDQVKRTRRFGR